MVVAEINKCILTLITVHSGLGRALGCDIYKTHFSSVVYFVLDIPNNYSQMVEMEVYVLLPFAHNNEESKK